MLRKDLLIFAVPALIVTMFILPFQSTVASTDYKVYPGSFCQPYDDTTDYRTLYPGDLGNITNESSYTNTVICPAITDHWDTIDDVQAYFWALDRHNSVDVDCTLHSRNYDGSANYSDTYGTSGNETYVQGVLIYDTLTAGANYSIYMMCYIPGVYSTNKSSLYSYRIKEIY